MKLKKTKVSILGAKYTIDFQEKTNEDGDWGVCYYGEQKIIIKNTLTPNKQKQVLIHEITHAVLYESGMMVRENIKLDEESICDFVARYAQTILKIFNETGAMFL